MFFIVCGLKVRANPETWQGYEPLPPKPVFETPEEDEDGRPRSVKKDAKLKGHWDLRLSSFQKLVFVKIFEEEKVGHLKCRNCLKRFSWLILRCFDGDKNDIRLVKSPVTTISDIFGGPV